MSEMPGFVRNVEIAYWSAIAMTLSLP